MKLYFTYFLILDIFILFFALSNLLILFQAIDIDAFKQDEGEEIDDDAQEFVEKMLEMSMAQMSLEENEIEAQLGGGKSKGMEELNKIFSREHMSTKVG